MKKTLISYTIVFLILGILLYFLSMSWMNFLFKPNLKKEIEMIHSELPRLHPLVTESQIENFSRAVETVLDDIGLFISHFDYYKKLAPAFTHFEDTFTYLDFWEGSLHSASVYPFLFKYREGELIIKDSIGNIIPSGSVVKKINEKSVDEIMDYYEQFVFAKTKEEKGFWVVERDLLNFYPEFFKAKEYRIQYDYESNRFEEIVNAIPWNEFVSWRKRMESNWYQLKEYDSLTVMKIIDLSYSQKNIYEIREVMNKIINSNTKKLLIDLTDAKGQGENYYNLQLFLSYLSKEQGHLIPRQITRYNHQTDAFTIIPQNSVFHGELVFLVSKYSVYPYIRALISFCDRTQTGIFVGEKPLNVDNYSSNPFREPLYISYLIPKVCRTINEFDKVPLEEVITESITFTLDDYLELLKFEKDYGVYFYNLP